MDEIASVGIKIDTSDIDGAIKNLDALAGKGAAVDKSLAQIEAAAGRTGKSLDSLGKSAGHAAGMDATAKGAQQAAAGLQGMARGLDGVTSATRAAAQEQEKLAKILAGGAGQFTQAEQAHIRALMDKANQLRMTGAEYERYAMAQRGMSDAAQTLGGAIRGQINALKEAERSAAGAGSAFAGIAVRIGALAGAFFSLQKMMGAAEEWTAMNNRLKLVTQGTESFAAAQKNVIDIANSSRQSLSATAELYQRLAMNQAQLGLSGQEMAGVVKTISQTMAISGTSAQSASAALVQLGQAFAAGTLRGDELNSVLEQAPALAEAIAKGMGKTVGELRAMGKEGQLTSEAVVNALKSQAGAVQESFEKMTPTIGQALTVVGNRFVALVGKLDDFTGASAAVAKAVQWAGRNMETLAVAAASVVAVGFVSWASAAVAGAGGLAAALAAAGGFGAMATAAKAFIASLGPIGWVTLAVGALATAVVAFQDELRGTGDEAVGLMDILGGLWAGNAQEAEKAASAISQSNEQAAKDTRGWWEGITMFFASMLDKVSGFVNGVVAAIANGLVAAAQKIQNTFIGVFNWLNKNTVAITNAIVDGMNAVTRRVGFSGFARAEYKPIATQEVSITGAMARGWDDNQTTYYRDTFGGAIERAKERNRQQSTQAASAAQQEAEKLKAQQAEIANQKKAAEADEMRTKILMELNHVNKKQVEGIKEAEKALEMGAITADEYRARVNQLNEAAYKSSDAYKEAAKSAKSRTRAGDGAAKQAEREAKAYQSLVRSIQSKTAAYENAAETEGKTTEADKTRAKILEDVASGRLKLTAAQQQALEVELQAMAAAEREAQWLKESKAENAQRLQAEIQTTDALKKQVAAQKEANEKFGLSAKALAELEAAKYRDTAATARRMAAELEAAGVDSERARQYREQADALDALADGKLEAANKEAQKAVADEWQRTTDQINQSLTDALLRGFEDGKGFAKNFRDTLKNMFRTLVLQPLIRPVVAWSGGMLSMLMSGMAGAAQGGAGGGLGNMGGFNFGGFGGMNNLGMLGSYGQMFANGATLLQQGWGAFSDNLAALWANGQYGSAFASGAGAAMSALGGIFGGRAIGQALSGGYSAWGRSGNSAVNTGTAAGAAIGSIIPGVGTAIGALVGGALGGVVNRLFGRKLKDYGIEGTFGGEEGFSGRAWKYYKGGWFRSNKTRYEALDEETRQTLAKPYQAVRDQLRAYAEALNIPTDKLNSVTHTLRLSLQGLKPEEIQQRYTEALGAAQEALAESLLREAEGQQMERLARGLVENFTVKAQDAASQLQTRSYFRRDGETAVQTLERMAASLATVNSAFALLGRTLFEASVRSGDMASRLVELFGQGQEGRNAFSQAVGSYYQNFYSETERKENARRAITQQIQDLGLTAPDLQSANARAQFRALVDGLDLTTDAGRRAFAALMRLQGAVAEVTEAAEDATQAERRRAEALKEALDAAQKATDAALSALEKAIDRQIGSLQTALQAAQDLASEARSVMQTAHAAARQLYGQTGAGNAMLAAQGQAFIRNALTSARAGVLPDATELSRAIEAARGGLTMDNYATVAEYERDQLVMAGRLQEIGDKAGGQLTLAEQQVAHLKTQIDLLTQQKEYWREQIAAMRGQGETLRSIDQALDWLRQKMQAERAAQQAANGSATGQSGSAGGNGSGFGPGPATPAHTLSYDANTGRLDVGGGTYIDFRSGERHYADGSVGRLNRAELDLFRYRALERGIRIPQFAAGGWHRGGLALVGEEGPELVHFAQPARIYNSADTRGMLAGGSGSSAEVAALRQDVAALRALLERIADASQRSADTLRNVTSETGGGAFAMMEVAP